MARSRAFAVMLATAIALGACSTFSLHEQTGVLPIAKQRRASDATLVVMPFAYAPEDPDDARELSEADLVTWQQLLVSGIDQSNIFATVRTGAEGQTPPTEGYVLHGRITNFRFQKNWVPTFFPLHLALSFFTLSAYTLFGGPTTATIVRFSAHFELQDAASGTLLAAFDENYRSTRAVNVYSKGAANPYDNPNVVFAQVITSVATRMAAALP